MGMKDKFLRGCAIVCATIAIISCLNGCRDKTPEEPQQETSITYSVSASSLSTADAYDKLKSKLISSYSDIEGLESAKWSELSIMYVHQDDSQFRDLTITAVVPVEDEDYKYCLITAEHTSPTYQHDTNSGLSNLDELYLWNVQNKENEIHYYSGKDFGAISENFREMDYTVNTQLIDESYYIMSDSMIEMIKTACNNPSLNSSKFFDGKNVDTYMTYIVDNQIHIYNVETMEKVVLTYSKEFENFQASQQYLTSGEYGSFTEEQLKALGYSFTPATLKSIEKKK